MAGIGVIFGSGLLRAVYHLGEVGYLMKFLKHTKTRLCVGAGDIYNLATRGTGSQLQAIGRIEHLLFFAEQEHYALHASEHATLERKETNHREEVLQHKLSRCRLTRWRGIAPILTRHRRGPHHRNGVKDKPRTWYHFTLRRPSDDGDEKTLIAI